MDKTKQDFEFLSRPYLFINEATSREIPSRVGISS